jgi:hypothetical protein
MFVVLTANMLQCMLTGEELPHKNIIGAHIFKCCWEEFSQAFLDIEDIDCPGNGLFLCKAVEDAFDRSALCFVFNQSTQG